MNTLTHIIKSLIRQAAIPRLLPSIKTFEAWLVEMICFLLVITLTIGSAFGQTKTPFSTDTVTTLTFEQSEDGCIIGNTSIIAVKDNKAQDKSTVYVTIQRVDSCNFGQQVELASGSFPASTFTPDDTNLTRATLKASGQTFDSISQKNIQVDLNLTWAGTGDIRNEKITDEVQKGGFKTC